MEPETQSTLAMSSGEAIDLEAVARVSRGVLDGAVFALAMPRHEEWNGCLLLHAHGFRPHGMGLVAEVDDPFWWRLVQQGASSFSSFTPHDRPHRRPYRLGGRSNFL